MSRILAHGLRAPSMIAAGLAMFAPMAAYADPVPRPAAFAICAACHVTAANATSTIGPNLWKVSGRKAGALSSFNYSPAMKASKLVWNKATLTAFASAPQTAVPGNRMPYAGQKDPAAAQAIVGYLLSLK